MIQYNVLIPPFYVITAILIGLKGFGSNYVTVHLLWGYNIPNLALECITAKSFVE